MQTENFTEDLIPAESFCTYHRVDLSFIRNLHNSGLIEMTIREDKAFLPSSGLGELEKLIRLHYELDINLEGIEAITHLLTRLNYMQAKVLALQNRIAFYQGAAGSHEA